MAGRVALKLDIDASDGQSRGFRYLRGLHWKPGLETARDPP